MCILFYEDNPIFRFNIKRPDSYCGRIFTLNGLYKGSDVYFLISQCRPWAENKHYLRINSLVFLSSALCVVPVVQRHYCAALCRGSARLTDVIGESLTYIGIPLSLCQRERRVGAQPVSSLYRGSLRTAVKQRSLQCAVEDGAGKRRREGKL